MANKLQTVIVVFGILAWQGCGSDKDPAPVDCSEDPVVLELVSLDDSNCELSDGIIEVKASGGSGTYKFALDGGSAQTGAIFSDLGAGTYTVTAIDDNTCSASVDVTIRNTNGLNITLAATDAGGCGGGDGTLTVTAFDGAEPYQYRLGDGAFSSNHEFGGLAAGLHRLTVMDASGCEVNQNVRVRSGVSFGATIKPIIESNCAISSCHNGSQHPDFRVLKNIQDNAGQIKALTGDGTMPQEGSLTQNQINQIACWVDDGALNN